MDQPNFAGVRVLIVGAQGYAVAMLRAVLNAIGIVRIEVVEETRYGLDLLRGHGFDVLYIEEDTAMDGAPFALAARRSTGLVNPMIPIFVVYSGPRRRDVEKSRDLGINDVIARPVSPQTVKEKLLTALVAPRPFIAAPDFFGPDRRSKARTGEPYFGKERRVRMPKKAKITVQET